MLCKKGQSAQVAPTVRSDRQHPSGYLEGARNQVASIPCYAHNQRNLQHQGKSLLLWAQVVGAAGAGGVVEAVDVVVAAVEAVADVVSAAAGMGDYLTSG